MKTRIFLVLLVFFLASCNDADEIRKITMRFDQLDKEEFEILVADANREVDSNNNFDTAIIILEKAKHFITDEQDGSTLSEALAYVETQKAEHKKRTSTRRSGGHSEGSSNSGTYTGNNNSISSGYSSVNIEFSEVASSCCTKNPSLSVSSSNYGYDISYYNNKSYSTATCYINAYANNTVSGTFNFTFSIDEHKAHGAYEKTHRFSGNFTINGNHRNYTVTCSNYDTQIRGY